ncbi:multidrug transporter [Brucella endophytica]|uniref:Multidrug transporter n=1 Tax=Brucella endophytica TaxID=1963359 RepID=A0A916SE42_9HYPH|nr:multidrug efflux SMR transporter [Brucella endophytica]GGA92951.1 multidrug transporter [Brucella endophytica]
MQYFYLLIAIAAEVVGTSFIKQSNGFTKLGPTLIMGASYMVAFYFLSLTLRTLPVGIAYAIWSGVGVILIAIVAWLFYGQRLDAPAIIGLALIVAGVVIMNLFSSSVPH